MVVPIHKVAFGTASALSIFQRLMDSMLQVIPGTICYLDNILVTARVHVLLVTGSNDDHFKNLEEVLKHLMNTGLRLKKSKCALMQDLVQYLGHRIDTQGVHTPVLLQTKLQPYRRHPLLKMLNNRDHFWD